MPQVLPHNGGAARQAVEKDFLPLNGTDYVEFYVGNARQAAYYYRAAFGFSLAAYRGPETGTRDRASYVVAQNKIRFVLTTPLEPEHPIADHIRLHGDGVRDIALWVDDAEPPGGKPPQRGARSVREPETLRDEQGEVRIASIAAYGDSGGKTALHPWEGETSPKYTGPTPPYTQLDENAKYSWLKTPSLEGQLHGSGPARPRPHRLRQRA